MLCCVRNHFIIAVMLAAPVAGCGGSDSGGGGDSGDAGESYEPVPVPGSTCNAVIQRHAIEGAEHITDCSPTSYGTSPPSSGAHYGTWAAFRSYSEHMPQGFVVHALEHGAVVLSHSCTDGCDGERAAAESFVADLPSDCPAPVERRVIINPDATLETRWAAAAWGYTLTADCFEEASFRLFFDEHYGNGPEDLCADGVDVLSGGLEVWCAQRGLPPPER